MIEGEGDLSSTIVRGETQVVISASPTRWRAFGLTILFVLAVTFACFWVLLHPAWVQEFQTWGYVGAFVINVIASATIVLPVPGAALIVVMSSTLNPWWLSAVSGLGSAVGELSGYFAGRSGQLLMPESQRATYNRVHRLAEQYGAFVIIPLAAFPFPLFDVAGIVAGATGMNPWAFFIATAIGKTIKYFILILLGAGPVNALQQWLR